jgi:low temperature requirement protein LtrA
MLGLGVNYIVACGLRALVQPQHDLYASIIGLSTTVLLTLVVQPADVGQMAMCFAIGVGTMAVYRLAVFMWMVRSDPVIATV